MKFFKLFNLCFFDGSQTNAEEGASDGQELDGERENKGLSEEEDNNPEPENLTNLDPYAAFNEKSPLLYAGQADSETEEDPAPAEDPAKKGPEESGSANEGSGQIPEQSKPYKVLKYRGQEVPVMSEEDLIRLASQGIDYTRKTQQIAPYRALIERVERDPALAQRVVDMIRQADQGYLPDRSGQKQPPQPQNLSKNNGPEPEQREDETWDEFVERREQWLSGKDAGGKDGNLPDGQQTPITREQIAKEIEAVIAEQQRRERVTGIINLARQDEHHEQVVQALLGLPDSVKAEMNVREDVFQLMYDMVRSEIEFGGKKLGKYFLPIIQKSQGGAPIQQQQVNNSGGAAKQQQPGQTVSIKGGGTAKTPFTENSRGGTKPGAPSAPQKSIWDLSPEEFRKLGEGARLE